jgi:hypothetical protein
VLIEKIRKAIEKSKISAIENGILTSAQRDYKYPVKRGQKTNDQIFINQAHGDSRH